MFTSVGRRWGEPTPFPMRRSAEREGCGDLPGAFMPRADLDRGPCRRADSPFALRAIAGELGIGQEGLQRHLVGASLELAALDARLAGNERGARGQADLVHGPAHRLPLERALGHVRREVAAV